MKKAVHWHSTHRQRITIMLRPHWFWQRSTWTRSPKSLLRYSFIVVCSKTVHDIASNVSWETYGSLSGKETHLRHIIMIHCLYWWWWLKWISFIYKPYCGNDTDTRACAHIHTHTYTRTHARTHARKHTHTHTHTHTDTHTHTYMRILWVISY